MEWMLRLLVITSTTVAFVAFGNDEVATPVPTPIQAVAPLRTLPDASQTPSTTTLPTPPDALCPQWWAPALEAGWSEDLLPTLDYVMWRESRCDPGQHNTTRNKDGSTDLGLTQINDRSWCLPTRWYPDGYLQTIGTLSDNGCQQLFSPTINLKAAKNIYDYALEHHDNGWQPWKVQG